jgi:glycosyltransferase involved in cell wall biosynthesis
MLLARELGAGGSERQLAQLAMLLDTAKFTPHVGCFRSEGFRADELRQHGVPILEIPVRSFMPPASLQGARLLWRYLREHHIKLVHAFDVPLTCFGVPVARAARVPCVLSSLRAHRQLAPRFRSWLRFTDRLADGVVANCHAMERHLLEEGVPQEKIHVCYNWVDSNRFHPAGPAPKTGPLKDAPLVIGVICVLRAEKGLATLIDAFAAVHREQPGLKLLIVGGGPMKESLERRAAGHGIGGQCHMEPAVKDVAPWLRRIDIFVLPSLSEALSNSLMEAMASGCCPIASRVGGNPELVLDGDTGLLFEKADALDLAAKMRLLIRDEALRKRLASRARNHIQAKFNITQALKAMEEVYLGSLFHW